MRAQAPTDHMEAEKQIAQRVRAALESDRRVNLHRFPIKLRLNADGSLLMEGDAESVAAKKLALRLAAATPGVTGVVDRLRVVAGRNMGDGELRDHLRNTFLEEPVFDNHGITLRRDGSALVVRPAVEQALVEIEVSAGVVTLNGKVRSFSHKCLAGALAWWAAGTRDVINGLEVAPPRESNDDDVEEAARLVLEKDPLINADEIRVRSENHVVTLDGFTANEKESEMAEADAWCVFGIDSVINLIRIGQTP